MLEMIVWSLIGLSGLTIAYIAGHMLSKALKLAELETRLIFDEEKFKKQNEEIIKMLGDKK